MIETNACSVVVLDFETTGLSPDQGDRAIEIGAVRVRDGQLVERFSELMNPGRRVSGFIESYTGISNKMLSTAQPCSKVMARFAEFIGDDNLVAHNASFDKRFLDAELQRLSLTYGGDFSCSLLASRRLNQEAPNHKLATLVSYKNITADGVFHRALYDAEMAARIWLAMIEEVQQDYGLAEVSFELMQKINKTAKGKVAKLLTGYGNRDC